MGGQIAVEGEPGRGSTFAFTARFGLPPSPAESAAGLLGEEWEIRRGFDRLVGRGWRDKIVSNMVTHFSCVKASEPWCKGVKRRHPFLETKEVQCN
jgi:hypothetical protein